MSNYAKNIFPDDKKKNAETKAAAVEDAMAEQFNAEHAANRAVRDAQKAYNAAIYNVPYKPAVAVAAKRTLGNAEADLEALKVLNKELFG